MLSIQEPSYFDILFFCSIVKNMLSTNTHFALQRQLDPVSTHEVVPPDAMRRVMRLNVSTVPNIPTHSTTSTVDTADSDPENLMWRTREIL